MTTTLNTQKGNILLVEVPIIATGFYIKNGVYCKWLKSETHGRIMSIDFKCRLLGVVENGIADFKSDLFVEKIKYQDRTIKHKVQIETVYRNYMEPELPYKSASTSFMSLINAHGLGFGGKKYVALKEV